MQHHKSSPYYLQANGAIEATNKNVLKIIENMAELFKGWPHKLSFTLWGYIMLILTSIGATSYSIVYEMDAVFPIEK